MPIINKDLIRPIQGSIVPYPPPPYPPKGPHDKLQITVNLRVSWTKATQTSLNNTRDRGNGIVGPPFQINAVGAESHKKLILT